MKRCPECRRDYYDVTLSFCLDDGATLLEGPAMLKETKTKIFGASPSTGMTDEPQTKIFSASLSEAVTKLQNSDTEKTAILPTSAVPEAADKNSQLPQKFWLAAALVIVLAIGGFWSYKYFAPNN